MTVNDYLEFVGSGMMMTALKAFGKNTGCSLRYEWKKSREEAGGIGSKGPAKGEVDTFYWEYMIYRLHVAGNVICDCEGMAPSYKKSILKGLHDLMDDMPMYLKAIALKKALDGCFLTLGRSSVILTREHVLTRLNELRRSAPAIRSAHASRMSQKLPAWKSLKGSSITSMMKRTGLRQLQQPG